ncbi:MAG: hypothetical protein ACXW5U_04980 [Thermoanaerobaculia bacterium]
MIKAESVLQWLALPSEFGVTLLIAALALSLAPYLAGSDFGLLKVPQFPVRVRARLRSAGPVALLVAIFLHLPLIRTAGPQQLLLQPIHRAVITAPAPAPASAPSMAPDEPIAAQSPTSVTATMPEKPSLQSSGTWKVHLLIPSAMSAAAVHVDGESARIVRRAPTVITIVVPPGAESHEIRVEEIGRKPCVLRQSVEDEMTLTPCQS